MKTLFKPRHSTTWRARIRVNGTLREQDTRCITHAAAKEWVRCARLQIKRAGKLNVRATCAADL